MLRKYDTDSLTDSRDSYLDDTDNDYINYIVVCKYPAGITSDRYAMTDWRGLGGTRIIFKINVWGVKNPEDKE